jgi:hypothetical protein
LKDNVPWIHIQILRHIPRIRQASFKKKEKRAEPDQCKHDGDGDVGFCNQTGKTGAHKGRTKKKKKYNQNTIDGDQLGRHPEEVNDVGFGGTLTCIYCKIYRVSQSR